MARFLKWIVNIILLLSIVIAGALLIPPLTGVTTVIIDEVDMDTNLDKGSVTYAIDDTITELEIGDKILVSEDDSHYVYRVRSIDTSDGTCILEDESDAGAEPVTKTFRSYVPKVVLSIPFIGYISMAMRSTEGLIIIGLAVVFVVILFVLAELWRSSSESEEEDEEDEEQKPEPPVKRPVHDMSSQIMEEASNAIASAVSNVVEQEKLQEGRKSSSDVEGDILAEAFEMEELEEVSEEDAAGETEEVTEEEQDSEFEIEQLLRQEETLAAGGVKEEAADIQTDDELQTILQGFEEADEEDAWEEPEEEIEIEESVSEEPEPVSPEEDEDTTVVTEEKPEEEPEEEPVGEKTLAMPVHTAEELLDAAKKAGDNPKVIKDDDSGVTILDYSDLL